MKKIKNIFQEKMDKPVRQLIVSLASMPESSPEALDFGRRSLLEAAVTLAETIVPGRRVRAFVERDAKELQHPHIHIIYTNSKP